MRKNWKGDVLSEDEQGRTDLVAFMETLFSSTTDVAPRLADDDSHITTTADAFSELSLLEIGPSVDFACTSPESETSVPASPPSGFGTATSPVSVPGVFGASCLPCLNLECVTM